MCGDADALVQDTPSRLDRIAARLASANSYIAEAIAIGSNFTALTSGSQETPITRLAAFFGQGFNCKRPLCM